MMDITLWAVPFGIVGGRAYHVATSFEQYFGAGGDPIRALFVWEGGMGIWGAIALGALGAWVGARRAGVRLAPVADALAPGILVAQGIGRLGNWFNHELFGGPTDLPWGLRVSGTAARDAGYPAETLFHPTFLYEMLWNFAAAAALVALDRRWRLGHGRVFALYMSAYSLGRAFVEGLRIDPAHHVFGLRLNVWTSFVVALGGLALFGFSAARHPGRDTDLELPGRLPGPVDSAQGPGEGPVAGEPEGQAGDGDCAAPAPEQTTGPASTP
jgi:prolipoprotein diacylglyceryl transferase